MISENRKIDETRSQFLKKINKIDKPLARLTKRKVQIINISSEGGVSINSADIKHHKFLRHKYDSFPDGSGNSQVLRGTLGCVRCKVPGPGERGHRPAPVAGVPRCGPGGLTSSNGELSQPALFVCRRSPSGAVVGADELAETRGGAQPLAQRQRFWGKSRKAGRIPPPSCNRCKATAPKTHGVAEEQTHRSRGQPSPDVDPRRCGPLILDKDAKEIWCRRDSLFNQSCWKKQSSVGGGGVNLDPNPALHAKSNSK